MLDFNPLYAKIRDKAAHVTLLLLPHLPPIIMKKSLFLLLCLGSMSSMASDVTMKPTHLSLFKNGYGFIKLEGTITQEATQMRLRNLPVPSIGTFWMEAEEGVEVLRVVSGEFEESYPTRFEMMSLAAANPGAKVQLSYRSADDELRMVKGEIMPFPKLKIDKGANTIDTVKELSPNPTVGSVLLLKDAQGGVLVVPANALIDMRFESAIKQPYAIEKRPGVELHLKKPAPQKNVSATCLSSGITWLPSYRMDLNEDGTARFIAKATITNQLMDLQGANIDLITGAPALENPGRVDPMALRSAGRAVMMDSEFAAYSNAAPRKAKMARSYAPAAGAESLDVSLEQSINTGSLFFFPLKDFSAKLGQVVTQDLYVAKVDYKRVCTWEVEDPTHFTLDPNVERPDYGEVWNCVRFVNPLEMPLTSAPIEFMEKSRIAGTNTIKYTGSKQECTVRMNSAMNVLATKKCQLVSQQKVSAGLFERSRTQENYSVVLSLTNTSDKVAEVEISQNVVGKVAPVADGGVVTTTTNMQSDMNARNLIRWKVQVPAGEKKEISFSFERLR